MADYVASVCRSAYYHLRQIRPTVQSLTPDGSKTLVQAFISGRLDYCNSLIYGMTDSLFQRLQSVQNAAARLITRTGRREHITPVLREQYTMAARSTSRRLQAGHVHVQDAARPDTTVLVGRLSAHLRHKSPTTVVGHVYICRATNQNSSGWQIMLSDHRYGTASRQICALTTMLTLGDS